MWCMCGMRGVCVYVHVVYVCYGVWVEAPACCSALAYSCRGRRSRGRSLTWERSGKGTLLPVSLCFIILVTIVSEFRMYAELNEQVFPLLRRALCKNDDYHPMNLHIQYLLWEILGKNVFQRGIIRGNATRNIVCR